MFKFEFGEDDLFVNRLKTYPEYNVFIYQSRQYINKDNEEEEKKKPPRTRTHTPTHTCLLNKSDAADQ